MRLLIDGYNVLFQSDILGRGRGPGFLVRARQSLLREIASRLTDDERREATVVFDARDAPPGGREACEFRGITVLFARDHEDADALIEELIAGCHGPRSLTVVSSDRRIRAAARRRRAASVDSETWLESIRMRKRGAAEPSEPRSEKPDAVGDTGMGEWRAYFELPPSAPDREPDRAPTPPDADPSHLPDPFPPGYADPI
ncbi:MAG: hypothetical protein FJ297_02545 [Planctomycetes bacterium]|nr:hypothetical protein [Planctomycetota bacterium]